MEKGHCLFFGGKKGRCLFFGGKSRGDEFVSPTDLTEQFKQLCIGVCGRQVMDARGAVA